MGSLFNFTDVLAKNATTKNIQDAINDVLKSDDNACYNEMEPRLLPPGIAGSRFYDQAAAVAILLSHDKVHGGIIHTMMVEKRLNERMLWDLMYKALRKAGFKMKSGRLIGLLEDKSDQNGEEAQGVPDIE